MEDHRLCEVERKLAVLEAQRETDQDAIKLLRENKRDLTGTVLGAIAVLVSIATLIYVVTKG